MIGTPYDDTLDLHALVEQFFSTTFSTDNPLITEAVRRMLAAGGKRLRPRMTLLAAHACGASPDDHLYLAAYMELIHVATLIHDDVVDNAETRRGVNATAVDFGNRVSVLAGDYLFAWIFKNVTQNYPPPVPHILSATLADICDGEVLQLRALGDLALPLEEYVEIARKKTASLFSASAQCGAIMSGGTPEQIAALHAFGDRFGIAFQMKDDLLDMISNERSLGKPVGNDLTERKMTIPLVLALAAGNSDFRQQIHELYAGSAHASLPAAIAAIGRQGGLDGTRLQIAKYVEEAKRALQPLAPTAAKDALANLADALLVE